MALWKLNKGMNQCGPSKKILLPYLLTVAVSAFAFPLLGYGADLDRAKEAYMKGDYQAALKELRPLAEQGSAPAQDNLGLMYAHGEGVPKNAKEALKWFRLAVEQGFAPAQYNLGAMYSSGRGIRKDYREAVKWYRSAAEQGFASAQRNLGAMYYRGEGVHRDYVMACMWWNLADANGNAVSQGAKHCLASRMTKEDIAKAEELSRKWVEDHPNLAQ